MKTIVVTEQGSRLSKTGGQIVLYKEGKKIYAQPMHHLALIIIMGRVELSAALTSYCLRQGIDVVFMSLEGRYKGRLSPPVSRNVFIRRLQYEKLNDKAFKLAFSREVVRAKTLNYGRMLQKKSDVVYQSFRHKLNNMLRSLQAAETIEQIRGFEGSFSNLYFRHLPALLKEDFGFKKRIKHPPPDPLNILLSLAYTMLFNNVYAYVEAAGLDPYCGFYHDLKYGHPALISDLMEEFRAPVADAVVISLINLRRIAKKHFSKEDDKTLISKEGLAVFFDQYRKKITEKFAHKNLRLNYLQIIERQVWHFMRFLKGEEERYAGYRFR